MSMFTRAARRRGFTLIELLIVIVVISILALIVIPKVSSAGRKAKEATLKSNLYLIRQAIALFQSDTGYYPATLDALLNAKTSPPATGLDDSATSQTVPTNSYQGPYLLPQGGIVGHAGMPCNPFVSASDGTETDHWTYSVTSGTVGNVSCPTAISGTTLDGVSYQSL